MGRQFDFSSPGAAFTETMAKVLAERKAEERQAMLDRLTMAAEERAGRAEQRAVENQKGETEYRNVNINRIKHDMDNDKAKSIESVLDPSIDPTTQLSPEDIEFARGRGLLIPGKPAGQADVTTDYTIKTEGGEQLPTEVPQLPFTEGLGQSVPMPDRYQPSNVVPMPDRSGTSNPTPMPGAPAGFRYIGSAEYREKERQRKEQGSVIIGLLSSDDPRKKQVGEVLAAVMSGNNGQVPADMWNMLMPDKPLVMFDEATGKSSTIGNVPYNAGVVTRNRPPQQPVGMYEPDFIGKTAEGYPILKYPSGKIVVNKDAQIGPDPNTAPLGIPNGAFTEHNLSVMGLPDGAPEDIIRFKQTAKNIVTLARVKPVVKNLITTYIDNPMAGAQALAQAKMSGLLQPEDMQQVEVLLQATGAKMLAPQPQAK